MYVCSATRRLGDGQCVILRQSVRGSVRAVRAVQNSRVFQTEIWVVADDEHGRRTEGMSWPAPGEEPAVRTTMLDDTAAAKSTAQPWATE